MGPGPALYMGGRLAGEVLGCNVPPEQLDIWVPSERGWGSGLGGGVKKRSKKRRQMGEKEQGRVWDKVIKGEEDKANWVGRSDNSFVMKP